MKYTELELKVIEAIGQVLNYDTLEENIEDNATGLEIQETCEITGLNPKQVRGIFSSLEKKGLMYLEEINMGSTRYMQITEEGLKEYYRLFENNTQDSKEESNMIKVIERKTGTEYKAERIEGGYQVYTLAGEKYKKLKESTFKKYFKLTGEGAPTSTATVEHVELSDEKRAKMIAKIKKMLNLAKDNPSMEEGLSAALQAQRLMKKYNIHKDDVELEEIKDEITSVFSEQKHNSNLHAWRKPLAQVVAKNFRCKCYLKGQDIAFRGYTEDAKIALDVYTMLYAVGDKLGSKAYTQQKNETGSGRGAYNSFVTGFVGGVQDSLGEQCTALMVITPKEVEEEFKEFSKNMKSARTKLSVADVKLYNEGYSEGKSAVKSRSVEKKGE